MTWKFFLTHFEGITYHWLGFVKGDFLGIGIL